MKKKLVVVGNGMAGMKVVEELLSASPNLFDITVFGAEPHGNYNRIMLSEVLSGEKSLDDIMINDKNWYAQNNIALFTGLEKSIIDIDRKNKIVTTRDGTQAQYDKLLIATGSTPYKVPIDGCNLDGVMAFRDITDVKKMMDYSKSKRHAVVLGGGLLGLEAASGLIAQGMNVTVIHRSNSILNRQLDNEAAKLLQNKLENLGIAFELSAKTKCLLGKNNHVTHVEFDNGKTLPCDLFVMAVGITPNTIVAQKCGLHCNKGIVVNDTLQTFDPSIYSVGECIEHRGNTFGLVAPVFEQAKVCANHLAHHGVGSYITLSQSTKLKITGVFVFSAGVFQTDDKYKTIIFRDGYKKTYKKLVVENNVLIGAVLYGDTQDGAWYQHLIESKKSIASIRPFLIFGQHYCEQYLAQISSAENDHTFNPSFDRLA